MNSKRRDNYVESEHIHKQYLKGRKIVLIVLVATLLSMSVAYAADLSQILYAFGYATIDVEPGNIEITNVKEVSSTFVTANSYTVASTVDDDNKSIVTFNGDITYYRQSGTSKLSMVYDIVITNNTFKTQTLTNIKSNPTFVQGSTTFSYTVDGVTSGVTAIKPGESVTATVEFYLASGNRKTTYQVREILEFVFTGSSGSVAFPFNARLNTTEISLNDFTDIKPISIFVANNSTSEVSYNVTTPDNNFLIVDESGNALGSMTIPASTQQMIDIYLKINDKHLFINESKDVKLFVNLTGPTILNYPLNSVKANVPVGGGSKILGDKEIIDSSGIDFTSTSNTPGVYTDDMGEETYFYRGNTTNNYVSFAGLTWRIVKLDRNGTKLILDGVIDSTSAWASSNSVSSLDNAISILKYENSLIKPILDTWYENTLSSYADAIVPTIFCQDFNYQTMTSSGSNNTTYYFGAYLRNGTDSSEHTPQFGCSSEFTFTSNIGLLSSDEASFAGSVFGSGTTSYYLYNSSISASYWLLSPSYYDSTLATAGLFNINGSNGTLNDWPNTNTIAATLSIRPVITINTDRISSGRGTSDDMYIVS